MLRIYSIQGPNGWQMNGDPTVLVSQPSAAGGSRSWEDGPNYMYAIKRNHSDMVKFYPRDPCYMKVKYVLKDLIERMEPSIHLFGDAAQRS